MPLVFVHVSFDDAVFGLPVPSLQQFEDPLEWVGMEMMFAPPEGAEQQAREEKEEDGEEVEEEEKEEGFNENLD